MKVGQKSIVRWIAKRVTKRSESVAGKSSIAGLRELNIEQLHHVSGGGDGQSQLPKGVW